MQLYNAISCWSELEKINIDNKGKGIRGIGEFVDSLFGSSIIFLLLTFGIFMGWAHIPDYLGDGYNYDNFDR